jgi:hypothetical protein
MSGGKPVNLFQGRRHPHHRNSTIRYLKPQTLLPVRRESRQTVDLGANWCKTLQMVAGGRFELYSAYPILVRAVPASVIATK